MTYNHIQTSEADYTKGASNSKTLPPFLRKQDYLP